MWEIDRWALAELNEVTQKVLNAYEAYDFREVYQTLYSFSTIELSALYFDIIKDRLYTSAPVSVGRRSAQTALFEIVTRIARLAAPILAFTADEIWENIPGAVLEASSVHLTEFPAPEAAFVNEGLQARYQRLFEIRSVVMKSLEDARNAKLIGAGLEAKVTITGSQETLEFLTTFGDDLRYIFIVSQVELSKDEGGLSVSVQRADGIKCERCWNYTTDVGSVGQYPGVCARCASSLDETPS
jgi:isoleucyl-tRNA synthetase